jgi:hypothetical protein
MERGIMPINKIERISILNKINNYGTDKHEKNGSTIVKNRAL